MASNWKTLTLRLAGVTLIDCDHRTPPPAESGYPYVAIPQIKNGRIELSDARKISHEHFVEWTRRAKPVDNDVVLSRRCNPGETAFVSPGMEFALGQNLVLLRADGERVYPPFLRWLVRGQEWWGQVGKFLNVGAVFDSLKCADIPNFELQFPPIIEQRAIADILSALDDKIELNRRMNETLESIARALFKSWFVDFDPVRAKSEGLDPGLPKQLADLFSDSFEDSEFGEIPIGWSHKGLDEIAHFLNGLALQKYPPTDGRTLPVVKIAQLRAGRTVGADRATADLDPSYIISDGDILFSWSGTLECVVWAGGHGALNQHLFKVTSSKFPRWLCYFGVHQHLLGFRQIAASKATTMGHIQRRHLADAKIAIPPLELLGQINRYFEPLFESFWAREVQSRTLTEIRDALLPKLISGELRVKSAEKIVAAAV